MLWLKWNFLFYSWISCTSEQIRQIIGISKLFIHIFLWQYFFAFTIPRFPFCYWELVLFSDSCNKFFRSFVPNHSLPHYLKGIWAISIVQRSFLILNLWGSWLGLNMWVLLFFFLTIVIVDSLLELAVAPLDIFPDFCVAYVTVTSEHSECFNWIALLHYSGYICARQQSINKRHKPSIAHSFKS